MIGERRVLLGIEHLEQRARGIALEAPRELVDLVEHEHGIIGVRALDALDDPARHRADVGAPVAADLGVVAHAAQAAAHELATERAGDRLAERRLADARRADEQEDRTRARLF